jgi:hypothetical protein
VSPGEIKERDTIGSSINIKDRIGLTWRYQGPHEKDGRRDVVDRQSPLAVTRSSPTFSLASSTTTTVSPTQSQSPRKGGQPWSLQIVSKPGLCIKITLLEHTLGGGGGGRGEGQDPCWLLPNSATRGVQQRSRTQWQPRVLAPHQHGGGPTRASCTVAMGHQRGDCDNCSYELAVTGEMEAVRGDNSVHGTKCLGRRPQAWLTVQPCDNNFYMDCGAKDPMTNMEWLNVHDAYKGNDVRAHPYLPSRWIAPQISTSLSSMS